MQRISEKADTDTNFPLMVGTKVGKFQGYSFNSVVLAVFQTTAGEYRVVCESTIITGLIHIFSPTQLYRRH